jgi:hypothetical protein
MKRKSIFSRSFRLIAALLAVLVTISAFPPTAVYAAGGDLTLNEDQAEAVAALGFSTEQPKRYSPGGNEIDRTKSPFGVNKTTSYRVRQLMVNTIMQSTLYQTTGDNPGLKTAMYQHAPVDAMTSIELAAARERVSLAADTNGDGKDETIAVYWTPDATQVYGKVGVAITKYASTITTGGAITKVEPTTKAYPQVGTDTMLFAGISAFDYIRNIYAVSGDFDHDGNDEVAIGRGDTIAICRVTDESLTVLSILQLNNISTSFRAMAEGGNFGSSSKTLTVNGMLAADLDDDGFKELFVTAGRNYISKVSGDSDSDINDYERGSRSYLMIYRATTSLGTLSAPTVELTATAGENTVYIDDPGLDMGDIFGDGEKELVIGGRLFGRKDDNNVGFTTLHYDPESETYQTGLRDNRLYTFVSNDFKAVKSKLGVKCVNFNPAAFMSYVVLGGYIYKYNPETDAFDRQTILAANDSGFTANSQAKAKDSLTNVNINSDQTYILDMESGNFNENTLRNMGTDTSEQLVVLHHNNWHSNRCIYVTTVSMSGGVLYAYMKQEINNKTNGYYMSICAPDIYNRGLQMEFLPAKSQFIFSDPTVVAVLAATPYYSELESEYEGLGNAKTLFGTQKSKSSSTSNGLSVTASYAIGFEWRLSMLGTEAARIGLEAEISNEFTATFEKYSSITKHVLYENYYNQNAVVVSAIPYDCYYFKTTDTQTGESSNTMIMVPFSPVTRIMSFSSYKKVADTVSTIPQVSDVFKHTVGDPRTYPTSSTSLSNVTGAAVQLGTNGDDYGSFVGVGIGNNVTEEEIDITQGQSRTLENTLEVKFSVWGGTGGFYVKAGVGLGYTYSSTKSSEETAMYSGSVAGLPEGREGYSYKWSMAAYPYDLTAGDAKQRCMVVNYLCQPVGANYPPAPAKNLSVDSRSSTGIKLKWDKPVTTNVQTTGLPSGYTVYRADSEDGEYTRLATVSGKNTVTYTDTTATKNISYYYRLTATNTRESLPAALAVLRVKATGMTLKTAPTLSYTDGAALDLSKLAVTLTFENGQTQDVAAANFGSLFLTSLTSGGALSLTQHGDPLTVTYVPENITLHAGTLSISAAATYDIELTGSFTVGNTTNATALVADKKLGAVISLKNNTSTSQPALVILALYSDKGAMVASSTRTATVAAGATSSVTFARAITLPSTVSGYSAKLFVWDGTSITDTKQVPKSNVITLP